MPETVIYERNALIAQIWQRPLSSVCKDYKISDVQLAKICKQLHIPRPPRGYFMFKRRRPPPRLPALKAGQPARIVVERARKKLLREETDEVHADVPREVTLFVQRALALDDVKVGTRIRRLHPFVADTGSDGARSPALRFVSEALTKRAQALAHTLLTTLAELGAELEVGGRGARGLYKGAITATIGATPVRFRLRETLEETAVERRGVVLRPTQLTGLLEVELLDLAQAVLPRRRFTDSERRRIDDRIKEIVVGIGRAAAVIAHGEAPLLRAEEARKQEARERERAEQRRKVELVMVKDLEERVRRHDIARQLRVFLRDRGATLQTREAPWPAWVAWATRYLEALDDSAGDAPLPAVAAAFLAGLERAEGVARR